MLVGALLLLNAAVIVFFMLSVDTTREPAAVPPLAAVPEAARLPEPAGSVTGGETPKPATPAATVIEDPVADADPSSATLTGAKMPSEPLAEKQPLETAAVDETVRPAAVREQVFKIRKPKELPPLMANLPADTRAGLPDLELTVHVFSDVPSKSFVFINDRRYREGETLREGPHLESIEKQGVILSYEGTQFLLPGRW